jgi:hypothetical protein
MVTEAKDKLAQSCFLTEHPGHSVPSALRPAPLLAAFPELTSLTHRPRSKESGAWQRLGTLTLEAGEGLVPNFQSLKPWTGRLTLRFESEAGRLTLLPITFGALPSAEASASASPPETLPGLRQGLDCVIADSPLTLQISLRVEGQPEGLLLTFGRRAWAQGVPKERAQETNSLQAFPPRSQIAEGGEGARHRCSPTSLRMVLEGFGQRPSDGFYEACRHPAGAQFFGLWPQNLARVQDFAATGLLLPFRTLAQAAALLDAGFSLVPSIRFGAGQLPGAPLKETGGHLVVLQGFTQGEVAVLDPAAPEVETVPRRYPQAAFAEAWLAHRGAAYVLWPSR